MMFRRFLSPIAFAFANSPGQDFSVRPLTRLCRRHTFLPTSQKMTPLPIPYDTDNVFAKILDGRLPCHKIFETDSCIAILDAFPSVTGHALLISKAPVPTIMDLSDQQAADVLKELPRLCRAVQQATGSDGVNVLHNGGPAAGQIVFHLHFHVLPRFKGDKVLPQPESSKTMIKDEEAAEILNKIKLHL